MISATTEATSTVSTPNARTKSSRDDQPSASKGFDALMDSNPPLDTRRDPVAAPPMDRPEPPRRNDRASDIQAQRPERGNDYRARGRDTRSDTTNNANARKDGPPSDAASGKTDVHSSDKVAAASDTPKTTEADAAIADASTAAATAPAEIQVATPDAAVPVIAVPVVIATPVTPPVTTPAIVPENTGAPQAPLAIAAAAVLKAQAAAAQTESSADATAPAQAVPAASAADEQEFAALIASATPSAGKSTSKKDTVSAEATTSAPTKGADKSAAAPEFPAVPVETTATANSDEKPATGPAIEAPKTEIAAAHAAPKIAKHSDAPLQPGLVDMAQPIPSVTHQQPVVAAVAASQLTATVATGAPVPLKDLAVEIAVTAQAGASRFNIRLDPAELGRIDVRMDVDRDGKVTSHLTVEKPETLAMLRQDAPQLQRALEQAGLKTSDGGLQFSLRDDQSSGQKQNDQEFGRNTQRLVVTDDDVIPAVVAGRGYGRMLGSNTGVDIRI